MNTVCLKSKDGAYYQFPEKLYTSNSEKLGLAVSHEGFPSLR